MRKLFTLLICFISVMMLSAQTPVRVGDAGMTFDLSNVPADYLEDVQQWITAGVEGGITPPGSTYDIVLSATNAAGINQAINELHALGGFHQIKLLNGTYTIDEAVRLQDSIRIVGESRDGVILNVTKTSGTAVYFGSVHRAGIENLTIKGGYGEVPDSLNYHMINAKPEFMTHMVGLSARSSNCWLDKISIYDSGNYAINIWDASHVTVRDCHMERTWNKGSGGRGYAQFSGNYCLIYNCSFTKLRHICIQRENCHHNVFYKNNVEQDFNFHSDDQGYNLIEQNVSVLSERLGSGYHSVMGPWSTQHRIPGPDNVVYRNAMVERYDDEMTYSDDLIVYSPVDYEWNTPVVAIDTLNQLTSFYPAQESGIANELELLNPAQNDEYSAGYVIPIVAKALGDFQHVKLLDNGTEIATDNSFPFSFSVDNLSPGNHTISLQGLTANGATITTETRTIVVGNASLSIRNLEANQKIVANNTFSVETEAAGLFKTVSLYVNGVWKQTDHSAPYNFNYSFNSLGTQNVHVLGQLKSGQWIESPVIQVSSVPFKITNPVAGEVFSTSETINIETESFNDFQKVSIYVDGVWKKTDWSKPYSFNISELTAGNHTLHLVGRTNSGTWHTSEQITIDVQDRDILIASPHNNHVYESGATITVTAKTFTEFQRVSLYVNGSWKKTDHSAPFSISKSGIPDGTHQVKLLGVSQSGAWIESNTITIVIGEPSVATSVSTAAKSGEQAIELSDEKIDYQADVKVYPNPFENQITIQNASAYNKAYLFDMAGKMVDVKQIQDNETVWYPKLQNAKSGIYILKLTGENEAKTIKLIRK